MGGNEWGQGEKAREHGADVLSCADNPSGEACQRGIAENKAYAGALASAGLIYLPGGMQITGAIGGTANAGIQYAINGTVNPTDVLIATYVGAFTANTGVWGTVGWNAAGGATSSYLNGDDPFKGGVISGAASGIGYGIGKVAKISLDKWVNPAWKNYEWVNLGMGISKRLPLDPRPAVIGNIIASGSTESIGQGSSKAARTLRKVRTSS
ncbi:VENN motif pre-toxin domain-containing protein [Klebsiella variicola]